MFIKTVMDLVENLLTSISDNEHLIYLFIYFSVVHSSYLLLLSEKGLTEWLIEDKSVI